jgi:hypothetical protein
LAKMSDADRKPFVEDFHLDMHGSFTDENLCPPIKIVQHDSPTKESFCSQANGRGGRVAQGGSAA